MYLRNLDRWSRACPRKRSSCIKKFIGWNGLFAGKPRSHSVYTGSIQLLRMGNHQVRNRFTVRWVAVAVGLVCVEQDRVAG